MFKVISLIVCIYVAGRGLFLIDGFSWWIAGFGFLFWLGAYIVIAGGLKEREYKKDLQDAARKITGKDPR